MRAWLVGLFLCIAGTVTATVPPIAMTMTPATCLAPCDVRVDVKIAVHPDNRFWVIQIDGERFQSSQFPLEGAQAVYSQPPITFKHLSPGAYEIVVVLYRVHGEQFRVRRSLMVN